MWLGDFLFYLHPPAGREQIWTPGPISNFFKHCYRSSLQMSRDLAGPTDRFTALQSVIDYVRFCFSESQPIWPRLVSM